MLQHTRVTKGAEQHAAAQQGAFGQPAAPERSGWLFPACQLSPMPSQFLRRQTLSRCRSEVLGTTPAMRDKAAIQC